jgi:hypothetical protein
VCVRRGRVEATGVKVLVEAWDGMPFYCFLVARADSERGAAAR